MHLILTSKQHLWSRSSPFSLTPENLFQTNNFSLSRNAFKQLLLLDQCWDRTPPLCATCPACKMIPSLVLTSGLHCQQQLFWFQSLLLTLSPSLRVNLIPSAPVNFNIYSIVQLIIILVFNFSFSFCLFLNSYHPFLATAKVALFHKFLFLTFLSPLLPTNHW